MVGVPEMAPLAEMTRPAGRPVAAQVKLVPAPASLAAPWSGVMDEPETEVWAPGLVTATELVIAQVKLVEPAKLWLSVAVRVTG